MPDAPTSVIAGQPTAKAPVRHEPLPDPKLKASLKRIRNLSPQTAPIISVTLIPLFYAAISYIAGILFAHFVYLRPSLLLAALIPLSIIAVLTVVKAPRLNWLPLAAVWVVLGAWSAETERAPSTSPAMQQLSDGLLRTIEGTVIAAGPVRNPESSAESHPETSDTRDQDHDPTFWAAAPDTPVSAQKQLQTVDVQLSSAEAVTDFSDSQVPIQATLRLLVSWPGHGENSGPNTPLECGQKISAVVRFLPQDQYHDPGVWNRTLYLESQQIAAMASVNAAKSDSGQPRLRLLPRSGPQSPRSSLNCLLNHARQSASNRLQTLPAVTRSLPRPLRATPEDAAMLTALLTGDRTFLTRNLRVGFERTGSFHLIVVSGLHLAILAGLVLAFARRLRLPALAATALTLTVSLAYAVFTGFAIPAQRSFWMIALYLIGRLFYRDRSPLNVLGFAALCLAAASPRSIFDTSLQMTLLAVATIAGIAVPLLEHTVHPRAKATRELRLIAIDHSLPPKIAQFRVLLRLFARQLEPIAGRRIAWSLLPLLLRSTLRLAELLFVTLVVELALALPMATYFHRITVYALPVNLCILPLLALLVPAAMLLLLVLSVWPAAAAIPAAACLAILHFSLWIVRTVGTFSFGDLHIPEPGALRTAVALAMFLVAILLARASFSSTSLTPQRRVAFPVLCLMAAAALWPRPVDHPSAQLLFEAIDVGQGDCLLLITPDGKTLLVDGGGIGYQAPDPARHSVLAFDTGEDVVSPTLWSRGIRRLDAVALSHAHNDHMGGLPAILRNFRPSELWVGNNPPGPAYNALLEEARSLGVQLRQLRAGDQFPLGQVGLRVLAPSRDYRPGPEPKNNDSLILQARYQSNSVLLVGDAEAPEEYSILPEGNLQSTLLKVGHHGSMTSTRPEFLAAVSPAWAVISCGRHNHFGHPRREILAELQTAHARTYRTDLDGATCFFIDDHGISAQSVCGVELTR